MYPRLRRPIPVAIIARGSDLLRILQRNRLCIGTSLQRASYGLVSDLFARQHADESLARGLEAVSGLAAAAAAEPKKVKETKRGKTVIVDEIVTDPDPDVAEDAVLTTLEAVVNGIITGRSIEDPRKVGQYISNQEARAELIANLVQTDDYRRLVKMMRTRSNLETSLLKSAERDDLNPSERLALLQLISGEISGIAKGVRANATNVADVLGLLEKADAAFDANEDLLTKKFAATTTQGREVIRRLSHRFSKMNATKKK
jgi:hypothetical protein